MSAFKFVTDEWLDLLTWMTKVRGLPRTAAAFSAEYGDFNDAADAGTTESALISAAAGAAKTIQEAAARARQKGLVAWPLEARLLEGQILAASGAKEPARAVLAEVEKEAAARGFRRIAKKAAEARGA